MSTHLEKTKLFQKEEAKEVSNLIEIFCDHCEDFVDPQVPAGVRLKLGKKEYVFHLCDKCQELLKNEIKEVFLDGADWSER